MRNQKLPCARALKQRLSKDGPEIGHRPGNPRILIINFTRSGTEKQQRDTREPRYPLRSIVAGAGARQNSNTYNLSIWHRNEDSSVKGNNQFCVLSRAYVEILRMREL